MAVATGGDNEEPEEPMVAKLPPKATPVQAAPVPEPVKVVAAVVQVDDEEAQMMARLASIRQKKAEAAAGAAGSAMVGTAGIVGLAKTMDDAEFLRNFGGAVK